MLSLKYRNDHRNVFYFYKLGQILGPIGVNMGGAGGSTMKSFTDFTVHLFREIGFKVQMTDIQLHVE